MIVSNLHGLKVAECEIFDRSDCHDHKVSLGGRPILFVGGGGGAAIFFFKIFPEVVAVAQ